MTDDRRPGGGSGLRLTYPAEIAGHMATVEIPLVIGVIGDFDPVPDGGGPPMRKRRFRDLGTNACDGDGAPRLSGRMTDRLRPLLELAAAHPAVKVRVLHATKAELAADVLNAPSVDQTVLMREVHDSTYGMFGGEPYALMLVDHAFSPDGTDLATLQGLATVGALAACPFVASADSHMFDIGGPGGFADADELEGQLASRPFASWHAFRERDEARFVALTVLGDPLAVVTSLVRSYVDTGLWTEARSSSDDVPPPGVDTALTGALARNGFLVGHAPLRHAHTGHRPMHFHQPERTALSELTSRLPHVLTSSMFLRAAACLARDSIGQAQVDLASRLDGWIQGYVDGAASVDDARPHVRGPLARAILRLNDVLGAPGAFEVDLQLRIDLPDVRSDRFTRHRMRVVCAF